MKEVITVAQKHGIKLEMNDINRWYQVLDTLGPKGKTSMLQDIEANRQTEVDSFSGDLIKFSDKHGVSVPVNDTLYRLIKTMESLFK